MTNTPLPDEQYADIRGRRNAYLASHNHPGAFACCSAHASADDVPALLAEVDRCTVALEVAISQCAKAQDKRDKHKQRAEIANAQLETLRGGLREIGGDPTEVQNLYAQLSLRGRQWKEAKAEVDQLRAELDQARASAFAEAIDRFKSLASLTPDSERAPGLNFAIGALMAMRDRAARANVQPGDRP